MLLHARYQLRSHLGRFRYLLGISAFAGALTVLGFAPFYFYLVPFFTLAVLCGLLARVKRPLAGFFIGLSFGLGMYGAGLSWMMTTLHHFAEMPVWLACLSTLVLCLYMASFTALAAWLVVALRSLWFLPFAWPFAEWLRGGGTTGFPWLEMGYSQVPSSLLTAYLPVIGTYGLSIVVVAVAVSIFYLVHDDKRSRAITAICLGLLFCIAFVLHQVTWTVKQREPVTVALLQGNISQETKWSVDQSKRIILNYLDLIEHTNASVIVLPETAFPIYLSQAMGKTREKLERLAQDTQSNILVGMLDWQEGNIERQKFNAVVSYGVSGLQIQHKTHLVPFGEFIPLSWLFAPIYERWFHMPHSDFSIGNTHQLFSIGRSKVSVSICYDEIFGQDLARNAGQSDYMISGNNGAWFGDSIGIEQYLQYSQARAIENQKMIARASNNGVTAIIDVNGKVKSRAPNNERTILEGYLFKYQGQTFYNQWQDLSFIVLEVVGVAVLFTRLLICQKKFT